MSPTPREPWRPGPPLLGALAGWVALTAWSGMVDAPSGFLLPCAVGGLLMALVGSGLRVLRVASYAVAAAQVVVGLLVLNATFAGAQSIGGVVPTSTSVERVLLLAENGARALNYYGAPVVAFGTSTATLLAACGLLVLLSVDVLAVGLRRPPLAALPLLVTLSVPVSILTDALALPVFVVVALLFLRLLASDRLDRWSGVPRAGGGAAPGSGRLSRPGGALLWQVSVASVLVALVAAPLVPVSDLLPRGDGQGEGPGTGSDVRLTTVNPFIRLRRELVEQTNTPLVYAETDAADPGYLRTTVLDLFSQDSWRPSQRDLPGDNSADAVFPGPPGLAPGASGLESDWRFQLTRDYSTTWLPLPYPVREVSVEGNWRFDERTLDVALVSGDPPAGLEYSATSFDPTVTAADLADAVRPPASVREAGTEVPEDLPPVIEQTAREVTAGADTDFERAVALQDWFRSGGGFTYSLEQRPGSGMDLLADFITVDRVGYCEQFASAMAAMGRTLGIPSRVAVGFLRPERQPDGRLLYTSDARHAWPEMYFSGRGWVRFEPTPSQRTGETPAYTRQSVDEPAPTQAPSAQPSAEATPEDQQTPEDQAGSDGGSGVPWWPLLALLGAVGIAVVPSAARRAQRRRRLSLDAEHLPEGAWAELRASVLDVGLAWPDDRSPREQARRVIDQVGSRTSPLEPDDVRALEDLLAAVERSRYGRATSSGTSGTVGATGAVGVDAGGSGGVATLPGTARAGDEEAGRLRTTRTVEAWRRLLADRARPASRRTTWVRRWWPRSLTRPAR
ncbi:Transglutaminase-like enzyme, putative cysteine protease [Nocardioides scoriae]|uniref:Transglutaminase-like enzyme, putative cysteine protease n=1 Tax=Nocardioides scoriae TaxID=642780 RepID=A0A1H1L8M8_9ACTN|nr:DUF3488 and transglutaminase-like domain-containing protein [Nocardioides scoriae]SDR70239.1 Transglutaminase-like enzyme, putative cysteine protease [Nocardioides scoriae]